MEHFVKYPVLPASKCPVCEKGHILLTKIHHGSMRSDFKWECSNPDCPHTVG